MTLELKRPIVFFDIESTGLDTQKDRIVELAAVKIFPDGTREEKCKRFNPMMPIPKEATAVHGISDADVVHEPPFYKVARGDRGIAAFFKDSDLGGFNIIHFDIPLLKKELERAGEDLDLTEVSVVDAMVIYKTREPRNLEAAVQFYCGKEHTNAHAALDDVHATVDVLYGQLDKYNDLPRTPKEIDLSVRHPDAVDRLGKLKWINGEVSVAFGKHQGRSLKYLVQEEPDYIHWMIQARVVEDGIPILRDALLNHFPTRETSDE